MKFTPKTEEQLAEENLIPNGVYDFEVLEAHPKVSKAAKQRGETEPNMIHLKLKVYEDVDHGVFIDDYLMEQMAFKLRHFCEETGLIEVYNTGQLSADMCAGRAGKCKIGKGNPQEGYLPKNEVKDYGDPKENKKQPQAAKVTIAEPSSDSTDPDWLD